MNRDTNNRKDEIIFPYQKSTNIILFLLKKFLRRIAFDKNN